MQVDYPNDVVSLHRCAEIIEGFFSMNPEYQALVLSKLTNRPTSVWFKEALESIKAEYKSKGDKIHAIKKVRELYLNPLTNITMGLKEAKDLVESW